MVLNPTAALYVPCINVRAVNLLNLSEVVPIFYLSVIFSNAHVKKLHIQYNRVKGSEGVTITKLQWIESIKNLFLHKTSPWIRKICFPGEKIKTFFFAKFAQWILMRKLMSEVWHRFHFCLLLGRCHILHLFYSWKQKSIKEINKVLYTACIKNGHFFLIRCLCQYFMILLSSRPGLKAANWLRGWHS